MTHHTHPYHDTKKPQPIRDTCRGGKHHVSGAAGRMGTLLPRPAEEGQSRERRAGAARNKRAELAGEGHPGSPSSALVARRPQADKLARSRASSAEPPRRMPPPPLLFVLLAATCSCGVPGEGGGGSCELSVERGGDLYSFALAGPTPAHRHGILSEDGFYKVAVNDSILWFQLCDEMLFNFDPPMCLNCEDCGGPLRCGTQCSALVSNTIRGYDVCTTVGRLSKSHLSLIDESNPQKGVVVKMFSSKCSISVSVLCDPTVAQAPEKFAVSGRCDYATEFRHPSGCARLVSASGSGWGWLGTLFITIMSLLGGYILIGAVYRYHFLGIRSTEAIPNLEFWIGLPQRIKTMFVPATRSHVSYNRDGLGVYAPAPVNR